MALDPNWRQVVGARLPGPGNHPVFYPSPISPGNMQGPFLGLVAPTPAPAPAPAPAPTSTSVPAPAGVTTSFEYPAAGNIPPSTDPYAYIDPTTGDVLPSVAGTSYVDTITAWVQANPILALGLAAGAVWLLMEFMGGGFGGGGGHRRRR